MRHPLTLLRARLTDYRETAVALGAIRRALNKEGGPRRISRSSYGFLRAEEYDKENIPAHAKVKPRIDNVDGKKYVRDTILWLMKVVRNTKLTVVSRDILIGFAGR
jgi:hypothetical protein